MKIIEMVLTILLVTSAVSAGAQVAEKKTLTLEGANTVIAAAMAEAERLNAPRRGDSCRG